MFAPCDDRAHARFHVLLQRRLQAQHEEDFRHDEQRADYEPHEVIDKRGLEAVMGKDVATLKRLFGEPRLDVVEVYGRKLQFAGKACVLDAFLYPDGKGGAEIVTYVDARRSDGAAVDRASCVDTLQRR